MSRVRDKIDHNCFETWQFFINITWWFSKIFVIFQIHDWEEAKLTYQESSSHIYWIFNDWNARRKSITVEEKITANKPNRKTQIRSRCHWECGEKSQEYSGNRPISEKQFSFLEQPTSNRHNYILNETIV